MENEYSLKAELDPAWAARPLALGSHEGRTVLVLADPGGEPLDRLLGEPMEIVEFLRPAVGVSVALGRMHRCGLIHKDLKPANILVNRASGEAWLTGFGIASRLPRERQPPAPPESIEGTLAYMAPEQTGRMNRSIDSRSDLYSLGVTLYQALTGSLPFTASDPMEWVHCHIARKPVPPSERRETIPAPVSHIIMKLLAKTAEERYQTAAGVESDLRRCLAEWSLHGRVDPFALGVDDTPDRLLIPEKLYGRAGEVDTLLASFDRIVQYGRPELVLVSGYSGIGKSAVVNELHKSLVPPRGLFASGKFDQYKRDIPYATLAQAFQSLIRPLLSKSEGELGKWRDALREALDPNGQLMIGLVPELKAVIGEQPPVAELPQQEAQRRLHLVFRRFINVFARPEHPLALFLDDLQWLDVATLDLMEDLLTQSDVKYLMLIGAYRDNEVHSAHPLMRKLHAMREAGAPLQDIVLTPLARKDLVQLIADSLHCESGHAGPLAELVHDKTTGNPFFAIQFIFALFEEGLLTFDHIERQWSWDLDRIHAKGYTDNVVDLTVRKLSRLVPETQNALKQLACLGNGAEFTMVRVVYHDLMAEPHAQLDEAVGAGFILRSNDSYHFVHDRVQEAAYSLIPQEKRAEAHLRIGMLMASHTPPDKLEERVYEIVNQLNRGSHLVDSAAERERIAELNLIAGRRAKTSTAYASALMYLHAGRRLLNDEAWTHNYGLVFSIESILAECELLTADMIAAELRLSMLAERARSTRDIALVTRLRLTLYTALDRSDRAVEVFLEYWRDRGTNWSPHPTEEQVLQEYGQIWRLLGDRQIEALIDLPLTTDADVLDILDVFTEVVTPALFIDAKFLDLVICRMVSLSLEHGNSDGSCYAYIWLGLLAGPHFGNYQAGFRFGKLGYDLVEKRGLHRYQARTYMCFGVFITPWTRHVKTGRELVRRTFNAANRVGDLTYASYSCNALNSNLLAAGDPLDEVQREAETGLEFAGDVKFGLVVDCINAQLALIRTLRGLTARFGTFNDEHFDELRFERHLASAPALALPECWYWIRKAQARYLAGDYPAAVEASSNAERLLWTSPSFFEVAEYHFYSALARAACFDLAADESRQGHLDALAAHHGQHEIWAQHCPENFESRSALVAAELARIEGRILEAEHLYELAIRSAHNNGFVHVAAIAYEVAARFYAARGFQKFTDAYLLQSKGCFQRWGADGKVRQIDELYPHLREQERLTGPTSLMMGASVEQLDLATVIKVSQAVSGEMVLDKLMETLMRTAIEHAGAERGLLLLLRGDELRMTAEANTSEKTVSIHLKEANVSTTALPQSIVQYVLRTRERVILNDASAENPFSADSYVRQHHARSILCLPLINQAKLIGVLYLENSLASHVFTRARIAVLKLLASQAAISLESARLYKEAQQMEAYLKAAQTLSRTGSFGWRPATRELLWSEETYQITGYDRGTTPTLELVFQRIHPEDTAFVREVLDRGALNGEDLDLEHRLLLPDGSVRWVHVLGYAVRDETGSTEYIGAIMDITARKEAEDALRKLQVELAHTARLMTMGELVASIAHEVNQPLASVVINACACLRWLDAHEFGEARRAASLAIAEGHRASEVIGGIRALAKKTPPQMERLDVNETIREVFTLTRSEMQRNGIALETELAEHVPVVLADRIQLQQVILNLMMNAIEAMSGVDQRPRELLVRSGTDASRHVVISVQDSGPGIQPHTIENLFDAFYTTKPQGLGMGLSISRSIIDAHGGRLWATANVPCGAVFQFTLPIGGETLA
jgi:PAS domain S-box-containing protein